MPVHTQSTHFSPDELLRYSRHFSLSTIGIAGQEKLRAARVLCIGAGGLGCPALLYLTAAGVGHIGIVDDDCIELSNLHRQILYNSAEIGEKKIHAAKRRLAALNPNIYFVLHDMRLDKANALDIIGQYDIVIDGTDNFATRYLVNELCVQLHKPNIHASILEFSGQCSVFSAGDGPCYRCLYDTPPAANFAPKCSEIGVLGVLPGLLGTLQATEALKLILGIGDPLIGRLLTINALTMQFDDFQISRNLYCPTCGSQPITEESISIGENPTILNAMTANELAEWKKQGRDFILLDVREPAEYNACNLQGLLIPLQELPQRLQELSTELPIVVHCKAGPRSQHAAFLLQQAGFKTVYYLEGGIIAWAKAIDQTPGLY